MDKWKKRVRGELIERGGGGEKARIAGTGGHDRYVPSSE